MRKPAIKKTSAVKAQEEIQEGAARITNETTDIVSRNLPVFYNPVMKHNRDMSLLVLATENRLTNKTFQISDVLSGSGIRSIRFLLEVPHLISHIAINDKDEDTFLRLQHNLKQNNITFTSWTINDFLAHSVKQDGPRNKNRPKVELPKVVISNMDATQQLLSSNGYDYIDIDPFGSPNAFLDAACKRIARNGILAVTLTDTSAPAGSYPDACMRKYWAKPGSWPRIHEAGLRIFLRKVQLVAAQYDKALEPIFTYAKDHYYRAFFRVTKGKQKVDAILSQHGTWSDEQDAGPFYLGRMSDPVFVRELQNTLREWSGPLPQKSTQQLLLWLETIACENDLLQPGHYYYLNDLRDFIGSHKKEEFLEKLGASASPVHYEGNAIKTTHTIDDLKKLFPQKKILSQKKSVKKTVKKKATTK